MTDIREHETGNKLDVDLLGSMQRSFYVGEDVTQADIKAKFEDGILRVSIPKKDAQAVETKKTIAIEG